jgi:hypothetical protein
VELLQYKKKTLNMAEVLMGQYQVALKIWGEVVHGIQLVQDQTSCRSLSKQHETSKDTKRETICYLARRPSASEERFCSMN